MVGLQRLRPDRMVAYVLNIPIFYVLQSIQF